MSLDTGLRNWLARTLGKNVRFDEPMSRHTSFRVGGPAQAFAAPETQDQVVGLIKGAGQRQMPWMVVGGGTNLLVKDSGISGIVIVLSNIKRRVAIDHQHSGRALVSAGAGSDTRSINRFCLGRGLSGFNFSIGIPGTIGGAVMMNAGTALGTMFDVLEKMTLVLPDGSVEVADKQALEWDYRRWQWEKRFTGDRSPLILDCLFKLHPTDPERLKKEARQLMLKRKKSQPTTLPSAGCFFKNPEKGPSAGELIDRAGLKGCQVKGAQISPAHANFIVNTKNASAAHILALMDKAKEAVFKQFGTVLEPEVRIVGND